MEIQGKQHFGKTCNKIFQKFSEILGKNFRIFRNYQKTVKNVFNSYSLKTLIRQILGRFREFSVDARHIINYLLTAFAFRTVKYYDLGPYGRPFEICRNQ